MRKAIKGVNDLAFLHPQLVEEWDYAKNEKGPEEYLSGSSKKAYWKCRKCNYVWQANISTRALRGYGCPRCSGKVVTEGVNDLAHKNPELAKEWHSTKNGDLKPTEVSYGSKKRVWWECPKGHVYDMPVDKRSLRGSNCPICSGHRTVKGINDFATVYPEMAKEWHPTKNSDKTPDMFSSKNGYRAWWMCKYGHEWQQTIHVRSSGTGCPYCKNRYSSSFAEQALFFYISKIYPDAINRFKEPFDNNMEFDVYIPSLKTAIEYDGWYWHNSEDIHEKEIYKYQFCKSQGIRLLRIKEATGEEWSDVADKVFYISKKDRDELQSAIQTLIGILEVDKTKNGTKFVEDIKNLVDIERDSNTILEYLHEVPNSLVELRPDLIDEWNYEKNGNLTPDLFGINSNEKVWWKCKKCNHEWRTMIIHRAGKRNSGCPKCSPIQRGKTFSKSKALERGSLATRMPELLKQWAYDKNTVKPTEIALNYNKKVWWRCDVCKYEWESSPNHRSKGVGCPCCSGRMPRIGVNDLKTINPQLTEEWDYSKNEKGPEQYLPNSGKTVWWICKQCGHSWEAVIRSRNIGHGCPKCNHKKKK